MIPIGLGLEETEEHNTSNSNEIHGESDDSSSDNEHGESDDSFSKYEEDLHEGLEEEEVGNVQVQKSIVLEIKSANHFVF